MTDRDPSKASESIQRSLANRETIAPSGLEDSTPTGSGPFTALPSQFGRYRVTKLLGRGAMGTVYLAHDPDLGKEVALKVPKFSGDEDPVLLERFRREARAAGDLNHENICGVYEVGQIGTTHFIAMQYIDGRPLSDYISADVPQRKVAAVVRKLALGLAQAHDRGIVHRDLKPANVMANSQGEPIIMDFGLARHSALTGDVRATQSGMIVGSPAYMAPEQARGENDKIGPWTDIYGLGTLFFELLTGSLPFRGSMLSVLGQLATQPPPKPSSLRADVDPKLESLCLKMLEKKPQNRPASMTEVAQTLTDWLKGSGSSPEIAVREDAALIESAGLTPAKPAATPRAEKADAIEAQKQRVTELLDKHQYGPAIELLEKMVNLRDARFEKLVAWAKPKLKEVRATEQNLREASAPLCDTAQQLLKHYDYTGAAELLAQVPPAYRSIELRDLLEKVTDLRDECDHLQRDIEEAVRTGDTDTLPALVKRLYKLRPNNKAIKQLYADMKEYGAAKVIARRKGQRRFLDPAGRIVEPSQIVLAVVAILLIFVAVYLTAENYCKNGKPGHMKPSIPTTPPKPDPHGGSSGSSGGSGTTPLSQTITSQSTGMKLTLIPEGTFTMGSPASETGRSPDEGPQHAVKISQPFYVAIHEVTQSQYESVMGNNPSKFSKSAIHSGRVIGMDTSQFPVESVSWFDAISYCNKLSTKDGLPEYYSLTVERRVNDTLESAAVIIKGGNGYRLPTEAEWEYACRARSSTPFHFGNTCDGREANVEGANPYGAKIAGPSLKRTAKVGSYQQNSFGLFDMHGNVGEWCFDVFDEAAYKGRTGKTTDPVVTVNKADRVRRGGSHLYDAAIARSAFRNRGSPSFVGDHLGFRVVRNATDEKGAASTAPAQLVYLDDLQETAFEVGWGGVVGKHGYDGDRTRECPRMYGTKVTHSLFPHAKQNGHSFVNYRLDGQYATFKSTVYNESDKFLKFEVLGDDKPLWTSKETNKERSSELCSVSVKGVQTLQLRIHCRGNYYAAWGWWIDPCLLTDVDPISPGVPPQNSRQAVAAQKLVVPVQIVNSIEMKLAFIPSGDFLMGSPPSESERNVNEKQRRVQITKPFYAGVHEVTQAEYARIMGVNPSIHHKNLGDAARDKYPVEWVGWSDAKEFCRKLSELPEEKAKGRVYSLPSEAQWEYACRADTESPFNFGESLNGSLANCDDARPYKMASSGRAVNDTSIVGSYRPNAFGLYDMHGNVTEWCLDFLGEYDANDVVNPTGAKTGDARVNRGGTFVYPAAHCRSAQRHAYGGIAHDIGFRVVMSIPGLGDANRVQGTGAIAPKNVPAPKLATEPPRWLIKTGVDGGHAWQHSFSRQPDNKWTTEDLKWKTGNSAFSHPKGTVLPYRRSTWTTTDLYLRTAITLPTMSGRSIVLRHMHNGRDFSVYVNGKLLVTLRNAPRQWNYSNFNLKPEDLKLFREGENKIAVHCHTDRGGNTDPQYVDIGVQIE